MVDNFFFLLDLQFRPDKISYGRRAYPSLSFLKRIGQTKWLELQIIGSDYGTENSMPPYSINLYQYYKICGMVIHFQSLNIPINITSNITTPAQKSRYIETLSSFIRNDKHALDLLRNG
ncbi:MAG: hypothetical protein IJ745_01350, partial [Bacteroidales bacterium]|nr:hypothetical protein [Bacteroidales bacterium]